MTLLIDSANLSEIKKCFSYFPCDGVTTNPSILLKAGQKPLPLLKEIQGFLPASGQLHAQVLSTTADEMVKEAHFLIEQLGSSIYIKVPANLEGLKAIKVLSDEGIKITGTAVYAPMQAFLAAKAGAKYVAPYVNRLDNMGADGVAITKEIHDILTIHHFDCQVLAASFRNTAQVQSLCAYGIPTVTVQPDILRQFFSHPAIDKAVHDFQSDFYKLCGDGTTMMQS